jgi:hypothetical protein
MPTKYKIGTSDPTIGNDPGAGMWNSEPKTIKMRVLKNEIMKHLPFAYPVIGDDAVKHMYHYFTNSGNTYTIDLQDMINDVYRAKDLYEDEVIKIKQFVNTLPVGTHNITTDTISSGYNDKNQNWNWYYAVGGYSVWIKGVAKVEQDKSGKRKYRLDYVYKVSDRYNWDIGKQVEIFGVTITDRFMGEFHRQGIAKEFNMHGTIKESIKWDSLNPSSHTVVSPSTGR